MNQTPNYSLNQWERSDRVLMEDFNADNAKLDAALKAEADARAAGDAALSQTVAKKAEQSALDALSTRSSVTLLKTVTCPAGAQLEINVSDINWAAWQIVAMDWFIPANGYRECALQIKDASSSLYRIGNISTSGLTRLPGYQGFWTGRLWFFTNGRNTELVRTITLGGIFQCSDSSATYSQVKTLLLESISYPPETFPSGYQFRFYGIR